jgi:hypothetical protein
MDAADKAVHPPRDPFSTNAATIRPASSCHIYGALAPPVTGRLSGALRSFAQAKYTAPDDPGALSMADKGYVFVPKDCEGEQAWPCRVHIALHGCQQDVGDGRRSRAPRPIMYRALAPMAFSRVRGAFRGRVSRTLACSLRPLIGGE